MTFVQTVTLIAGIVIGFAPGLAVGIFFIPRTHHDEPPVVVRPGYGRAGVHRVDTIRDQSSGDLA